MTEQRTKRTARLALANGAVFHGTGFGATARGLLVEAEVVFNTALTGYQESLTDPSYVGQILVQTTPLIGNTGVNVEDVESSRVQVSGFVVHELSRRHSNFRATQSLSGYLGDQGVLGIADIDTRALTRMLRTSGVTPGVLTDDPAWTDTELVHRARNAPSMAGKELVSSVGRTERCGWEESLGAWRPSATPPAGATPLRVVAIDCGAKSNILRHLTERGCEVQLVPHDIAPAELRGIFDRGEADGLFISNGPGDPAAVERTIAALRSVVIEAKMCPPTFGICLGHQLLALACGGRTYKLPFGHRGTNQPVRDDTTGKVSITSQNHGFAVDPASIGAAGGEVTHTHLNDGTVAGFRLKHKPVFSVQYHPEASPGPHDAADLFDRFVGLMRITR